MKRYHYLIEFKGKKFLRRFRALAAMGATKEIDLERDREKICAYIEKNEHCRKVEILRVELLGVMDPAEMIGGILKRMMATDEKREGAIENESKESDTAAL